MSGESFADQEKGKTLHRAKEARHETHTIMILLIFLIYLPIWFCRVLVATVGLSCPVACGTLVSQPGIKSMSPAMQCGFLTTGPLGKSPVLLI